MKEFLHLFTKVEDGLPKDNNEDYYLVLCKNEITNKRLILRAEGFFDGKFKYVPIKFTITHWLDLSKLTTKDKADMLANVVGNDVLVDRAKERKLNSSNDIAEHINKPEENL